MDRSIVYTEEQLRSTDFLFAQKAVMIALGQLIQSLVGKTTCFTGLSVGPNSPADMTVLVQPGAIYSLEVVDSSAYGFLAADSSEIMKQGLLTAAAQISCPAPTTSGYSINYLIQAAYSDVDAEPVVLPYYNSANPSVPYTGMSNNGQTQNTQRTGVCNVTAKSGTPAATGSQTTPAPDTGNVSVAQVTVNYGDTSIVAGAISTIAGSRITPLTIA